MISKRFIISALIAIVICQLVALLIWVIFDENYFIPMLFAPIGGLIFGYKDLKK